MEHKRDPDAKEHCTECFGMGGALPTECPRRPLSAPVRRLVHRKVIDFKGGRWVPGERHGHMWVGKEAA